MNPCAGFPTYSLSRGAPSPTWVHLQNQWQYKYHKYEKLLAERVGFEPTALLGSLVFKTSSLNRSDISPYVTLFIIPYLTGQVKPFPQRAAFIFCGVFCAQAFCGQKIQTYRCAVQAQNRTRAHKPPSRRAPGISGHPHRSGTDQPLQP